MTIGTVHDVEFGAELEPFEPDTSLSAASAFEFGARFLYVRQ